MLYSMIDDRWPEIAVIHVYSPIRLDPQHPIYTTIAAWQNILSYLKRPGEREYTTDGLVDVTSREIIHILFCLLKFEIFNTFCY